MLALNRIIEVCAGGKLYLHKIIQPYKIMPAGIDLFRGIYHLHMKKGFLIVLIMFFGLALHAQSKPTTKEADDKKQEATAVKEEAKGERSEKEAVKSVPAAKSQQAKPAEVTKGKVVRPAGARPARNSRPAARVVKPGRGR